MNKRITSLLLCFVMVFAMLATAVPVFAAGTTSFSVTSDKTEASPGETITYTITMAPVQRLDSLKFTLKLSSGLTIVPGSGKLTPGLKETLKCVDTAWTESTKIFYVTLCDEGTGYSSENPTVLMTLQCTVDDGASGDLTADLYIDPEECYDPDYDNIAFTVTPATVTITAAPKPATNIKLNKSETTIYTGNTETLVATVEPSDTTDTVVWTSSKESVATVDNTGKVTAVAPGTATITAKAGDKTATCTVTVENAPCTHTDKTNVDAKPSTCTKQGWEAYSKCNDCGQLFDKDGNEISAIPYLSLAAHSLTPVAAKAATCTENGNKAYYVCSGCSKWFEDATGNVEITDHDSVVLTALGHEYTEKVMDDAHKKATATDCRSHDTYWYDCTRGDHNAKDDPAASDKWYESTNAGPHSYDESAWGYKSESGHAHKCRYDDTHDTPVAHTPGAAATETTPQTCTECGYIITPALGHTHSLTPVAAKAATCTEYGNSAYYYCSNCSKYFSDGAGNNEIAANSWVINKLPHNYQNGYCTVCGAAEPKDNYPQAYIYLNDSFHGIVGLAGAMVPQPHIQDAVGTYRDAQYEWHVCSVCGYVFGKTEIANEEVIITEAEEIVIEEPVQSGDSDEDSSADSAQDVTVSEPNPVTSVTVGAGSLLAAIAGLTLMALRKRSK